MKKKLFIYLLCSVLLVSLTGCGKTKEINNENTNKSKIAEKMEKADILNWNQVYSTITKDSSKISDYNGKLYIYTGIVSKIDDDKKTISLTNNIYKDGTPSTIDNVINVMLKDASKLKIEDVISVIGNLSITGNIYDLENASIITDNDYNDKYYIDIVKENGHYYTDYVFDNNIGLPISYTKVYSTYTINDSGKNVYQKNEDKYTFKYDNNKNLIEENVIKYENGAQVENYKITYKYNNDNTISTTEKIRNYYTVVGTHTDSTTTTYTYEKNDKGQIVKKQTTQTSTNNGRIYKSEASYKYNNKNQKIKTVSTSSNSTTITTYEYNKKKQIVTENERSSWLNTNRIYTYEYDNYGNKTRKLEDGQQIEYFVYGIVGKK